MRTSHEWVVYLNQKNTLRKKYEKENKTKQVQTSKSWAKTTNLKKYLDPHQMPSLKTADISFLLQNGA